MIALRKWSNSPISWHCLFSHSLLSLRSCCCMPTCLSSSRRRLVFATALAWRRSSTSYNVSSLIQHFLRFFFTNPTIYLALSLYVSSMLVHSSFGVVSNVIASHNTWDRFSMSTANLCLRSSSSRSRSTSKRSGSLLLLFRKALILSFADVKM